MSPASVSILDELLATAPVITDGAWGTELQARGLTAGEPADLWNLSHPDAVEAVARAYAEAGSRIILTNTFRANRIALAPYADPAGITAINRAGVELSRRGAAGRASVFASIGPSGKLLIAEEVDTHQLDYAFAEQARALAGAGADGLVVETMTDLTEATIAVTTALATGLPVVACMVFDSGKQRDRTMMGVTPQQAAEALAAAGAHVIGANCGIGIDAAVAVCAALRAATDRPLWIKPNAGLPELVDGHLVYRVAADAFAAHLPNLVAAGAGFVGGCCGTTPQFIAALRRAAVAAGRPPVPPATAVESDRPSCIASTNACSKRGSPASSTCRTVALRRSRIAARRDGASSSMRAPRRAVFPTGTGWLAHGGSKPIRRALSGRM